MRIVMENQDATMCPIIASVAVSWVSKSVSASDLKVLAHGVVLLAVEMGLHKDTKLVVTAPEPVKCVLTEVVMLATWICILSCVYLALFGGAPWSGGS